MKTLITKLFRVYFIDIHPDFASAIRQQLTHPLSISLSLFILAISPMPSLLPVLSFIFTFSFCRDFGCVLTPTSFFQQKWNPRNFNFVMYTACVLSLFTFRFSCPSMQLETLSLTLSVAFLVLTNITRSSAYCTNRSPLYSSSVSSLFSMILLSSSDSGPPGHSQIRFIKLLFHHHTCFQILDVPYKSGHEKVQYDTKQQTE